MHSTFSHFYHGLLLILGFYSAWGVAGVGANRLLNQMTATMEEGKRKLADTSLSVFWFFVVFPAVLWLLAHIHYD